VLISKKFWDTLSAAEKQIVQDAAVEAGKYQREQARSQVAAALDNMKKNGMQVTEFPAAEVLKFADKMKPVISKHAASTGEATVTELLAELAKLRK
jgi:TRAP-type C4-dicarboxylate transport system substrate-binding protein